ncbi:hypothetical protein JCM8097_004869 [Rhodosporidiobolus ruineniae]
MSDASDHDSRSSSSKPDKGKQNEACTNCRAVKRRCYNAGDHTPCTRCAKQDLDCIYHQNKRGRKAGVPIGARGTKKRKTLDKPAWEGGVEEADAAEAAEEEAEEESIAGEGGSDWLEKMLKEQQAGSSMSIPPQPAAYPPHLPSISTFSPQVGVPLPSQPSYPLPGSTHPTYHNPLGASLPSSVTLPPIVPQPPTAPLPSASRSSAYAANGLSTSATGPSPASAGFPSPNSGPGAASSPGSGVHPTPATGGFSLVKLLQENRREPGEHGGATSPPRQSLADAFAPEGDRRSASVRPEKTFEDIVAAGILPEEQVQPLFDFYFLHLNPMTSLLDPKLHTIEFCRSASAILFTAILTVTTKVALPSLYPPSLKYAKQLLGQAFEAGINNLELIQAIATLVFWQDATEDSGARKLAYAIRCAFELRLHKRGKRPLPEDEMEHRRALNPERTWLYLTIADHRFGTQRGLPKMIDNAFRHDAVPWVLEHGGESFCPQEVGLVPLVELGRILDVFAVLISPDDGLPSMELLKCMERDVEAWRSNWSPESSSMALQPAQRSLVRFYAQVLQFQIHEVNLFVAIKRTADLLDQITFDPRGSPLIVFGRCIKAAIKVLDTMERELRFMVYSFDSMWVGTASSAIWLATNLSGMEPPDRQSSLEAISRLQGACTQHSTTPQSMAGYTARLLQHLLHKIKMAEAAQQGQRGGGQAPDALAAVGAAAASASASASASSLVNPAPSSAAAMPPPPSSAANGFSQPGPSYVTASLSAPSWNAQGSPFGLGGLGVGQATPSLAQTGVGVFGGSFGVGSGGGAGLGSAPLAGPSAAAPVPAQATPQHQQQQGPTWTFPSASDPAGLYGDASFLSNMGPPLQSFGEDLPFPAADDALWQSLFPLFGTEQAP